MATYKKAALRTVQIKTILADLGMILLMLGGLYAELWILGDFGPVGFGLKFLLCMLVALAAVSIAYLAIYREMRVIELLGEDASSCITVLIPVVVSSLTVIQIIVMVFIGLWRLISPHIN